MAKSQGRVFHVAETESGRTLATLLKGWLKGPSWGDVRKLIQQRRLMVMGNLCLDPARKLQSGDVVKLLDQPHARPPTLADVKICYRDKHVVVVEKPAGMTSTRHREEKSWPSRRKQLQPTLDELLPHVLAKVEARTRTSPGPPVPVRPVHRLDRETSGLMIFARTIPAERHLMQQFRKHTTHRRYLAVAQGDVPAQTIESRLVRDRGDGRRGSTTLPNVGKKAVTHVRPLERLAGYTLLECRLETGRTHQIRIHLAELGHPLCGEKVYHQPLFKQPLIDRSRAPRIALHAAELGFEHPITGEKMQFQMPLPADLVRFLDDLRKRDRNGATSPGAGPPEDSLAPAQDDIATDDNAPDDIATEDESDDE